MAEQSSLFFNNFLTLELLISSKQMCQFILEIPYLFVIVRKVRFESKIVLKSDTKNSHWKECPMTELLFDHLFGLYSFQSIGHSSTSRTVWAELKTKTNAHTQITRDFSSPDFDRWKQACVFHVRFSEAIIFFLPCIMFTSDTRAIFIKHGNTKEK